MLFSVEKRKRFRRKLRIFLRASRTLPIRESLFLAQARPGECLIRLFEFGWVFPRGPSCVGP
jgi:hypothetical protein